REKWDAYTVAIDRMLFKTSTDKAPWVIVEGDDKYYARIKVLKTVIAAIEEAIEKK
ncbi:MAG: phosphate--AMP phosphotransferase, partial [Eubacterium sp.]